MRKTLILLVLLLFLFPPLFADNNVKASKTKQSVIETFPTNENTLILNSLITGIIYHLNYKDDDSKWKAKNEDLKITYKDKSSNSKKFTLEINSKKETSYEAGFYIPEYCVWHRAIAPYCIEINMSSYMLHFNYSDIASVPGLKFDCGINELHHFWFTIETPILTENTKLELDPEYIIFNVNGEVDTRSMDACPAQRKIGRQSNGTMYIIFSNLTPAGKHWVKMSRSFDNGQTWISFWDRAEANPVGANGDYDPCLVIDSVDTVHIAWAKSWAVSRGISYMNWTSDGTRSAIYNVTIAYVDTPECVVMAVNSSDAIWFFWYDSNVTCGSVECLWNRSFYKNVWSPMRYKSFDGDNVQFPSVTIDSNDVIHIVVFGTGANDDIRYCNITDGVYSDVVYIQPNFGAFDQTTPCIVNDDDNNLYVAWMGIYDGSVNYMIRFKRYWFANQTWSQISNLSVVHSDGSYYGYPSMTIDYNNTLYICWSVSKGNASDGEWNISLDNEGNWGPLRHFTTHYKTTKNNVLYGNYPRWLVNYTWVPMMRPIIGFTVAYWNITASPSSITYSNNSVFYSGVSGTPCPAQTHTAYNVEETTATLKARVSGNGIANAQCGFIIGENNPVTFYDRIWNYTSTDTPDTGDFFYKNLTGLDEGKYYYVRCWIHPVGSAITWGNMTYFLTKVNEPSSVDYSITGSKVGFTWLNPDCDSGSTLKGVCRYSTTAYPTSPTDGAEGFNVTTSSTVLFHGNVTGLSPGTTYYMTVWSYVEASGSPTLFHFSDGSTALIANTSGGQYNISFKWENGSHQNPFNPNGAVANDFHISTAEVRDLGDQHILTASKEIMYYETAAFHYQVAYVEYDWFWETEVSVNCYFNSTLPANYRGVEKCQLSAYNYSSQQWEIVQAFGVCNGTYYGPNCTYVIRPHSGKVMPASWWMLEYGVIGNEHVDISVPYFYNDLDLCQLEAFNTTAFDWIIIQPFGGSCNGTYYSGNNTYQVNSGTIHSLGFSSYRLSYMRTLLKGSTTHLNVIHPVKDTNKCKLEAFNMTVFAWITIQDFGTCNGTFNANSTYTVKGGTIHGDWSMYRLTYSYYIYPNCTLVVVYNNKTEINVFNYTNGASIGYRNTETVGNFNRTYSGYVLLNCSETPLWFEVYWNTSSSYYQCYRQQIVIGSQKNFTFYLTTNKPVYKETTGNYNDSLIRYIYDFLDYTSVFSGRTIFDTYTEIYAYDRDYNKMMIHSEYWDAAERIYPMLLFGKTYFVGIGCSEASISVIGTAPTTDEVNPQLSIKYTNITILPRQYIIRTAFTGGATGMYVYYYDVNEGTYSSHVKIYDARNRSLMYSGSAAVYTYNYTFAGALHNKSYEWHLWVNSSYSDNSIFINQTLGANITTKWSYAVINTTLTNIFGYTPFINPEDTTKRVYWVEAIIWIVFVLLLTTISGYAAEMGAIVSGVFLAGCGTLISGIDPLMVTIGIICVAFAIIYKMATRKVISE